MKIKLFYSYSHKDENYRDELKNHLTTLKNNRLIDSWHDRKIIAGEDWNQEIENNMDNANIILLLFSSDFIASDSCQKEVNKALELKKRGIVFIPIILRDCAWKEVNGISNILALPKDGKPVKKWNDKDEAWQNVYEGIKDQVNKIRNHITPKLENNFKDELLKNPVSDCTLDKLFVYPDILEVNKSKQKLENNETDAKKLCNIKDFKHKYILIEGKEQSGKTSLCHMLYLEYIKNNFYPILINGANITGTAVIDGVVDKEYKKQYESTGGYWNVDKEDRILIIDDINNKTANDNNYSAFIQSIKEKFAYAVILIDSLENLVNKSTEHNYFHLFNNYSIKSFGHKKRSDLIKRCIENDQNSEFDMQDNEQVARLDKDTKHIDTIIESNIIPSYPIIIISTFNIIESATSQDLKETSYGHCYHAMITTQLYRAGIRPDSMNEYFNFLTGLAYFMFNEETKKISKEKLDIFLKDHERKYILDDSDIIKKLLNSRTLVIKNGVYSFQYVYIYYYFAAKYIADNFSLEAVKEQYKYLISTIHKKDNFNITTFIAHHAKNDVLKVLLEDITLNAMGTFTHFSEATLDKQEMEFLDSALQSIEVTLPSDNHNVKTHRDKQLEQQDKTQVTIDEQEKIIENNEDNLDSFSIEILKSAKSMDLIGQILKNQYGTLKRDELKELFEEGQNVGLRFLKSFIVLMGEHPEGIKEMIKERLAEINQETNEVLSQEKIQKLSQQMANRFSYGVVFGWLHKIVDSLGYDKLVAISNDVNKDADTVASQLINFSIHAWHKKDLDIGELKLLYKKFDKNHTAQYMLKDIVSRHVYMHKINYQKTQQVAELLGFSMKQQRIAQSKIDAKK